MRENQGGRPSKIRGTPLEPEVRTLMETKQMSDLQILYWLKRFHGVEVHPTTLYKFRKGYVKTRKEYPTKFQEELKTEGRLLDDIGLLAAAVILQAEHVDRMRNWEKSTGMPSPTENMSVATKVLGDLTTQYSDMLTKYGLAPVEGVALLVSQSPGEEPEPKSLDQFVTDFVQAGRTLKVLPDVKWPDVVERIERAEPIDVKKEG